jgi:hypothetical protein
MEEEYAFLPETDIEVRDITSEFGETLKNHLLSEPFLQAIKFPRLRFAILENLGYSAVDYKEIAENIGPNKIEVYETRNDEAFNAKYYSIGDLNFYVLTPKVTATPLLSIRTLIHETTHAIQDRKGWRESRLDQEVDAHFAEALYLVKNKKENEVKGEFVMSDFITAAKEYYQNSKYLLSRRFRKLREKMRQEVYQHYEFMNSIFSINYNPASFQKDFKIRKRLNGMPF